jgi:hypothetical protein
MSRDAPPLEQSSVWTAPVSDPDIHYTLEEALSIVLVAGNKLRTCEKCSSAATDIWLIGYELRKGSAHAHVREVCHDCGAKSQWYAPAVYWTCMEAMEAWEGLRTAASLFRSEQQNDLDIPLDQP